MTRSVKALVKRELLVWARRSAAVDERTAAKRAGVGVERLQAWELGDDSPTIAQLRQLGRAYKRPIAVFYLDEVPRDFDALHDYRRLTVGSAPGGAALEFAIRRARERREIALDLMDDLDERPTEFVGEARLSRDPEELAASLRERLGVSIATQRGWETVYQAFNGWRDAVESQGVLVFQIRDVDVSEVRGFSIAEFPVPIIAVNIKDSPLARPFTLLHEFTHLMLRLSGLCDLHEGQSSRSEERVEIFCNRVAGAALVPRADLLADPTVSSHRGLDWSDEELRALANTFKVNREVVLRRLLILERTTQTRYDAKREQFEREFAARPKRDGFSTPDRIAVSTAGPAFASLVLRSFHQERITSSDLAEYLGVRLKHITKIEEALLRGAS